MYSVVLLDKYNVVKNIIEVNEINVEFLNLVIQEFGLSSYSTNAEGAFIDNILIDDEYYSVQYAYDNDMLSDENLSHFIETNVIFVEQQQPISVITEI